MCAMGRFTRNTRNSLSLKPWEGVGVVLLFLAALIVALGVVVALVRVVSLWLVG